jgi:hypothetical protein
MFSTSYEFEIDIRTTEPITNATFYLPVPVKNGVPTVGNKLLTAQDFQKPNYSVSLEKSPPGLNLSGAYPAPGNSPWYVRIHADRITHDDEYLISIYDSLKVDNPLLFANTITPFGNESVIFPKYEFSLNPPVQTKARSPHRIEYETGSSPQKTWFYADYTGSSSTNLQLIISLDSTNSWKEGWDAWIANSYSDRFHWDTRSDRQSLGWVMAEGRFNTGGGVYPNLSDPEWQHVIQQSQQGAGQK